MGRNNDAKTKSLHGTFDVWLSRHSHGLYFVACADARDRVQGTVYRAIYEQVRSVVGTTVMMARKEP